MPLPAFALFAEAPGIAAAIQLGTQRFRHLPNGGRHIRFPHHRRFAAAEDPGLFTANAFAIVAQPVGMIQRNAGHHCHARIDDVGRIQAATQPDFQDHHVKLSLFEQLQRRQGAKFEVSQ
ncbi:hypothetical protein D3C78_1286270 [compost metagenome]